MLMKSVGDKLRRERIQRGIDLETLADMTRIHARYLDAIENGKPGDLPGGFFYRSFVRQYATALNLDMEEIEQDLERAKEAEEPILSAALTEDRFPTKQPDPIVLESNRRPGSGKMWAYMVLLTAVVGGCSWVYGWWNRMETSASARSQESQLAAPRNADAKPEPPATPDTTRPEPTAAMGVPVPAAGQPAVVQQASHGAAGLSPDDRIVMNLSASEDTWVSVAADGKVVFVGILAANETRTLGARESARIRTGNAGGLDVNWNGKSIGTIGPRGQVRTVLLTPDGFRISAPTPPVEAPEQEPTGQ